MLFINCILFIMIMFLYCVLIRPNPIVLSMIFAASALIYVLFSEYFILSFFLALSFLAVYTILKRGKDIFAPWNIFISLWFFAIGICALKITIYEKSWSEYMWFVVLTGVFSFLAGCSILYLRNRRDKGGDSGYMTLRNRLRASWNSSRFMLIITPIFILSTAVFILQYRVAQVIPIFADRAIMSVDEARIYVAINSYLQRFALTQVPIFMACAVFLILGGNRKIRAFIWFMLCASMMLIISYASRLFLGTALVTSLIARHYIKKRVDMKTAVIFALIIIVFIVTIPVYVRGILPREYLEELGFTPTYMVVAPLYLGVSMNFFVLENLIDYVHENGFSYGWQTLYPLRVMFQQKERLMNTAQGLTPGAEWMTSTILGDFYGDLGLFGVIFGMFILGVYISSVYYRMLAKPTPFNIILHSYNTWCLIFSIYANAFILFDYVWNIAVLFAISYFAGKIKGRKEPA